MRTSSDNIAYDLQNSRAQLWSDIRSLLVLAAPIIGITLSRMLMGFADFYQVSFLGTAATAAISPATMFVFTGLCAGMGIVTSVQTFASQALGKGERETASAYTWQSIYIALLMVPLAFIMTRVSDSTWAWIGAPEDVQKLQGEYCRVALWSLPFGVACAGLEGFFNGVQKPGVALKAIIAALVCNVVGNYLLIFGKFGLPALGVRGAAIATILGWALRVGILAFVFLSREFHENYRTRETWRFDGSKLRGLVNVGGPTGIQWMLDVGAWFLFFAVIMQKFGTATLAASNIGMQYMHIAFMPAIGVGIALCTLVGHAIGEGKPEIAKQKTRAALLVSVLYMGFIGLFFLAIPKFLVSFVSNDKAVIEAGVGVLLWAALFQVSDALCIIYINALRGAGDTRWPAIVLVILCWTVFLSGGYMMATQMPHWKHHGPWMMCTLYITILGILFWRRFEGGAWRKINLFNHKAQPENDRPMADTNAESLAETAGAMP